MKVVPLSAFWLLELACRHPVLETGPALSKSADRYQLTVTACYVDRISPRGERSDVLISANFGLRECSVGALRVGLVPDGLEWQAPPLGSYSAAGLPMNTSFEEKMGVLVAWAPTLSNFELPEQVSLHTAALVEYSAEYGVMRDGAWLGTTGIWRCRFLEYPDLLLDVLLTSDADERGVIVAVLVESTMGLAPVPQVMGWRQKHLVRLSTACVKNPHDCEAFVAQLLVWRGGGQP